MRIGVCGPWALRTVLCLDLLKCGMHWRRRMGRSKGVESRVLCLPLRYTWPRLLSCKLGRTFLGRPLLMCSVCMVFQSGFHVSCDMCCTLRPYPPLFAARKHCRLRKRCSIIKPYCSSSLSVPYLMHHYIFCRPWPGMLIWQASFGGRARGWWGLA